MEYLLPLYDTKYSFGTLLVSSSFVMYLDILDSGLNNYYFSFFNGVSCVFPYACELTFPRRSQKFKLISFRSENALPL